MIPAEGSTRQYRAPPVAATATIQLDGEIGYSPHSTRFLALTRRFFQLATPSR